MTDIPAPPSYDTKPLEPLPQTAPTNRMGRADWNLDFYKPEDMMGRSAGAQWVDRDFAQRANDLGKEFYQLTGKRVGINDPHDFNPAGPTEGRRRGTRQADDNPGAKGSQHLEGRAGDFQIQHLSDQEKSLFLKIAREKHGFGGVGFYGDSPGHLHLDTGSPRSWGQLPAWATGIDLQSQTAKPRQEAVQPRAPVQWENDQNIPYEARAAILNAHNETGIPLPVLFAQAKQESSFRSDLVTPNKTNAANPATGLFQMMPQSSWKHMVELHGQKYGITFDMIKDPRANALMAAHLMKFNADMFEKQMGRKPTDGEYYVQHFMGGQGGINLTKWVSSNPDAIAAEKFSAAAENNPTIFYDKGGKPRTVKEVYDWLNSKVVGTEAVAVTNNAAGSFIPGDRPIQNPELGIPQPPTVQQNYDAAKSMAEREANLSFWSDGVPAVARTNTASYFYDLYQGWKMAPDPNFSLTPDMRKEIQSYPDGIRERFYEAQSAEHFANMKIRIDKEMEALQTLQGLPGWEQIVLGLGNEILDPVALGVSVGTAGFMAPYVTAAKVGRVGKVAMGVAVGGASEGLGEAAASAINPNKGWDDVLAAAAFGGVIGGGVGALLPTEAGASILKGIRKGKQVADTEGPLVPEGGSTVGAKYGAGGGDIEFQGDAGWNDLNNKDVPYTGAKDAPAIGSAHQLGKSDNPAARLGNLGENPIGMEGHRPNPFAPSEDQRLMWKEVITPYQQVFIPAFRQYMDEMDLPWYRRVLPMQELRQFKEEMADYIRDTSGLRDTNPNYSEAVKRVANEQIRLQSQLVEWARNETGKGRAFAGFDKQFDSTNYLMRMYNYDQIGKLTKLFGDGRAGMGGKPDTGMLKLIAGSIRSAQPTLPDALVKKLAQGFWNGIQNRGMGLDDDVMRFFTGDVLDQVDDLLNDMGLDPDDIERVKKVMTPPKGDGASPRAKKRVLLDENYKTRINYKGGTGSKEVSFKEILINDADYLFRQYARQMTGGTAMSRFMIRDPKTGNILVNGITNDADFEKFVMNVKKTGIEKLGSNYRTSGQMDKDEANLRFQYNSIRGRPHYQAFGQSVESQKWARVLGLVDGYNAIRLMGQMGFAQMNELALVPHQTSLTAMLKHMPAFRRITTTDGRTLLRSGFYREIEGMIGAGTDNLGEAFNFGPDELIEQGINPTASPWLSKAEIAMKMAGKGLHYVSGMAVIDTFLERLAASAMAQHFADIAWRTVKEIDELKFVNKGEITDKIGVDAPKLGKPDPKDDLWVLENHGVYGGRYKAPEWDRQTTPVNYDGEEIRSMLNKLSDQLGMPHRIHVVFPNEIARGPNGGKINGTFYPKHYRGLQNPILAVDANLTREQAIGVALHEFGHFHDFNKFIHSPEATKDAIKDAWWKAIGEKGPRPRPLDRGVEVEGENFKGMTVTQIRPLTDPDALGNHIPTDQWRKYSASFSEWYADQVSMWISKNAEPTGVVERFFKNIAQFWKDMYARITGHQPINAEVDAFMKGQWKPTAMDVTRTLVEPTMVKAREVDLSKINKTTMRRFKSLGLDDEDLKLVLKNISEHAEQTPSSLGGGSLTALNIHKWDLAAATAFKQALFRSGRRMIQENDIGALNRWMSFPLVRTMLQFRTFMIGAYSKNFLHNAHLGAGNMAAHVATSSFMAGLIYMAQTSSNNMLQGKPVGTNMEPEKVVKASFARAGYATMMPAMIDSGLGFMGMDPQFAFRTSGQPSALWSIPAINMFDDFYKGAQSAGRLVNGAPTTKQDLKNLKYTLPYANSLPATGFFGLMGGGMPDKPTKGDRYKY
jgi:hypothetical protein